MLEVIVDSEGIASDLKELVRVGGTETDVEGGTRAEVRSIEADSVMIAMIAQSTGVANPERAYATFLIPEAR
ncbi:hypothetical protein [Methanopyrus sp.]